jgi:hypothetical protein
MSKSGRTIVNDVLGDMVVGDLRIVRCSPRDNQYRKIFRAEIRDVALIEDDNRAWIFLTHVLRAEVSEVDLFGVPDPADAIEAIRRLVPSTEALGQ